MPTDGVFSAPRTKRQQVYEELVEEITSSERAPGERLAPVKELAERFDTSVFTIQRAITDLQEAGYVDVRHGTGTFVTSRYRPVNMEDTVTLCMRARGHVFSDFAGILMERLADRGYIGTLLGTEEEHASTEEMVRRMAHSESRTVLVNGGSGFPYEVFDYPGMHRKNVVAVLSWETSLRWPGLYRVIHDREAGADLVVDYLRERGHERVLVVGTDSQIRQLEEDWPDEIVPAYPFVQKWTAAGGQWEAAETWPHPELDCMTLDEETFLEVFDGETSPTAVFGLRDADAWIAQDVLLRERPELARRIDVVGYANTPWSRAGHPPFCSVDYDLESIADRAMEILDGVKSGKAPDEDLYKVAPRMRFR